MSFCRRWCLARKRKRKPTRTALLITVGSNITFWEDRLQLRGVCGFLDLVKLCYAAVLDREQRDTDMFDLSADHVRCCLIGGWDIQDRL